MKQRRPSKRGLVKGVKVVLLQDEEAYYSDYAGNPKVVVKAGTVGMVGATDVPYVCHMRDPVQDEQRGAYFVCVDFKIPGVYSGNPKFKQDVWRCGVNPRNLKKAS
jgi:hypothetical protein